MRKAKFGLDSANPPDEIIDHAVSVEGWKIVLLARLCPFIPFRISNYVFGLSSISLPAYVIATWLGTLPTAIVYVYLGSLAGELAQLGTDPERNAIKWPLYLGGFFVLALFLTVLTKIAKRALASHDIHGPSN